MSADLAEIHELARALLVNLDASGKRRLLRAVARETRATQSARIARQQDPDGAAFAARKPQQTSARAKKGRIRAKVMFRKLRTTKFLKSGASDGEAWVGFAGRGAIVARVHQDGLEDAPTKGAKRVRYARRVLLGLTNEERERLIDRILENVAA